MAGVDLGGAVNKLASVDEDYHRVERLLGVPGDVGREDVEVEAVLRYVPPGIIRNVLADVADVLRARVPEESGVPRASPPWTSGSLGLK